MTVMRRLMIALSFAAMIQGAWAIISAAHFKKSIMSENADFDSATKQMAAITLSATPLNSRYWLVLSAPNSNSVSAFNSGSAIEMAYLTGGEKVEDIPIRLKRAVQSEAFDTQPIQDFVRTDIGLIVHRIPRLLPTLSRLQVEALPDNSIAFARMIKDAEAGHLQEPVDLSHDGGLYDNGKLRVDDSGRAVP